MECRASPVLGMHIPFLCWADDFATAFETFHQEIFTSLWVGGRAMELGRWGLLGWGGDLMVGVFPMFNRSGCHGWAIHV